MIKQPHHLAFEAFAAIAILTPLTGHGRVAEVKFGSYDCGFVDALGVQGLRQAHKREVNNALYLNSDGVSLPVKQSLPSKEALADYPDLAARFPDVAAKVEVVLSAMGAC